MKRPAVLIANPVSGRGRAVPTAKRAVRLLGERGFEVETRLTTHPGHASELAREASAQGVAAVFAMGGDGTLREVAAGLLGSETPLAPLPAGTANVLALALGLPRRPLAAARCYEGRGPALEVRKLDVGRCAGRPFLLMTTLGVDARALCELRPSAKRRWGQVAIALEGLRQMRRGEPPELEIVAGGTVFHGSFAGIFNTPFYGGPFRMAPAAETDDGRLDLVVLESRSRAATFTFGLGVILGHRHLARPDVKSARVEQLEVRGSPVPLPAQIDGDPLWLASPVVFDLAPDPLVVLAPRPT